MSLFNLDHYSNEQINRIIKDAISFKKGKVVDYKGRKIILNLFFEASTRTHYSFEMAALRLGCKTINFDPDTSSLKKDETMIDTIRFFSRMHPDVMIIRSTQEKFYEALDDISIPIINGGDGTLDHPTQTLLDLVTIYENFKTISNLKILIVGDIKHSRVAHSNIKVLKRLGNEIYLAGPQDFQEDDLTYVDLDTYLPKVDVVMLLRIQNERHLDKFNSNEYHQSYGLSKARYDTLKDRAIIMHPAPFNRDIEIASDVLDLQQCKIFDQMENGLYLRMAVIDHELR
ncbi:MAG: aspartate carbamoyltransferase catalytic subunit [Bacilli bacterium]